MTNIELLTKDQLSKYARDEFDLKLDMRKPLADLVAQVRAAEEQFQKRNDETEVVETKAQAGFLLNEKTGHWFPWTKALEDRGDLIPCDENGNPA